MGRRDGSIQSHLSCLPTISSTSDDNNHNLLMIISTCKNTMEVWTASHITNMKRLNTLKHTVQSAKHTLSKLTDSFTHRVSISYSGLMSVNVSMFISTHDCVFYDQGTNQTSQFKHLQYIQTQANKANINPETMIIFLDDDDLFLSYPLTWDSYDVIVGYQELPMKYVSPFMKLFADMYDYHGYELELMLLSQEENNVVYVKEMIRLKLMLTETISDFSGYSARLRVINDVFEEVSKKHRTGLLLNMVDLDIMNALDEYENKLDCEECGGFIYHRLMSSKDWI